MLCCQGWAGHLPSLGSQCAACHLLGLQTPGEAERCLATMRERPKLTGDLGFLVCTGLRVLLCKTSFLSSTSLLLRPLRSGFRPNMRGTGDMRAPGEGNDFLNIFYVKNCGCGGALPAVLWVWWVWVLWLGRGSATAAPWRWAWARGVLHPRSTGGRQGATVWALTTGT